LRLQWDCRRTDTGACEKIDNDIELNPDCSSRGYPTVTVVPPAANGRIATEPGEEFPHYPKDSDNDACNKQRVPVTAIYYTSKSGYVGPAAVSVITPTGTLCCAAYKIVVQ
jgi:hypothetical protein